MRYMIWNNKGGVGKTFLTYLFASEYAKEHPEKDVVVADVCPQSNLSEMMLGGNGIGEANLETLWKKDATIASYIKERYRTSQSTKLGNEANYFVQVYKYNKEMPQNLYLLPGDMDLDICSVIINYIGQAPQKNAWKRSRSFLTDLVDSFESINKDREKVFFFDCNPSFANYTEMAVIAADRIIVPCTADSASARGVHNLFRLIYGVELVSKTKTTLPDEGDAFDTFRANVEDGKINLPKVHLFIQNKSRSLDSSATAAFTAHIKEMEKIVRKAKKLSPNCFTENRRSILNVKDGNTLAAVANYSGIPLSKMKHKKYEVYGDLTQVNKSQIDALKEQIQECVKVL